jgi:steroid delta-isomerase-like uncharacterized protein
MATIRVLASPADDIRQRVRHAIVEAFEHGRVAVLDELLADDCVIDTGEHAAPVHDRDGMKEFVTLLRQGFPDLSVEVLAVVAEGDTVMAHWVFRGTHDGDLFGIPATGRRVELPVMDRFTVVDGRIADFRVLMNQLALLQALGVVPAGTKPPKPLIWALRLKSLRRRRPAPRAA